MTETLNKIYKLTCDIGHLACLYEEGRQLPTDADECLEMVEELAAAVKGLYGIKSSGSSQQNDVATPSDQELERLARQAIRAEQIYQRVADEMKVAQSKSEASCSDSLTPQQ